MRVLALTNLYPNPYQPHRAPFNRQQFVALAREHEVQVIAPIAWTGEWTARARGAAALAGDGLRPTDGIAVHHPLYAFTPKVLRGLYGRFLVRSVRECFMDVWHRFRPHVVLGCWAYPDGWAAVHLAREVGLPVAIKVHGSDVLTVGNHPARRRRTIQALAGADAVVAVSRDLAAHTVAMGVAPTRVHVVYNGIDRSAFFPGSRDAARRELGIASSGPLVLFVGNLVPVKGLDVLIDALALVAAGGGDVRCAIAGDGPLRSELRSRIKALRLEERVRLAGQVPQGRLPQWYRAADLVVLPSRSEGVPNVLLEAAACGTPCIASRVGGIPEILRPEALVPPGDPGALADRLRAFLIARGQAPAPARDPGSWTDSARALATVLQKITAAAPAARAG